MEEYIHKINEFAKELCDIPWFFNSGQLPPEAVVFETEWDAEKGNANLYEDIPLDSEIEQISDITLHSEVGDIAMDVYDDAFEVAFQYCQDHPWPNSEYSNYYFDAAKSFADMVLSYCFENEMSQEEKEYSRKLWSIYSAGYGAFPDITLYEESRKIAVYKKP